MTFPLEGIAHTVAHRQTEHETPAAGPWQEDEPEKAGGYLVEYDMGRDTGCDVMLYWQGDWWRWSNGEKHNMSPLVLRYARINSPDE